MDAKYAPRLKNVVFSAKSIHKYLQEYGTHLNDCLQKIDPYSLQSAVDLITRVQAEGGVIYVAGNGGSAAIAEHLCCDWLKGTAMKSQIPIRTLSLVSNPALLTAIANDVEYTEVFAAQLELLAKKGDLCLLISSSGKSANVVRAAQQAESMGLYRIGMTGFDGGELGKIVNVHLHVPSENYGVIEDAHQSIMHTIAQYLLIKRQHRS